ncbi:unnamed protein product [Prunus armeniaca]|uniref:Epidermal patterning factor-like protein n=1 Tax=Prunus armeniaca TaxID=36596 RepID=A0A6J5WRC8_PRUAR|nr:unnamed protein product [Prunus armeniaca]
MKRSYCFIMALQILCWISATSRPFPPNDGVGVHQEAPGQNPESLQVTLQEGLNTINGVTKMAAIANYRGIGKIGSSPPSCDHKCYGCTPCEAIQVPTTTKKHSHLGVQYANYEPESWKCKCGPTFYSP